MDGIWRRSQRAVLSNFGWRCTVYRVENGHWKDPFVCVHKHKSANAAMKCADREVNRRVKDW